MTREELREFCLSLPGVYADYPFDANWLAMRLLSSKKTFAFIYEHQGQLCVNVKCDPMEAEFQRATCPAIRPAYHMNKRHWNMLVLDGTLAPREVQALIEESYALVLRQKKYGK